MKKSAFFLMAAFSFFKANAHPSLFDSTCPSKTECAQIQSVTLKDGDRIMCNEGVNGNEYGFDCTDYFKASKGSILNTPVRIHHKGVDGCHIEGGCGLKACSFWPSAVHYDYLCSK